jgi:DnaK suppressor protein
VTPDARPVLGRQATATTAERGSAGKLPRMDPQRARELLAAERARIEQALTALTGQGPLEASDRKEPGDQESEDLYQDEFDAGRTEGLHRDLAALERAEGRLEAGTYGLSVESGQPIPDGRLEAIPTAELTVEEQARTERR